VETNFSGTQKSLIFLTRSQLLHGECSGGSAARSGSEEKQKNDQNKLKPEESSSEDEDKEKDQKFYGKGQIVK
jgi:hypothetical protein